MVQHKLVKLRRYMNPILVYDNCFWQIITLVTKTETTQVWDSNLAVSPYNTVVNWMVTIWEHGSCLRMSTSIHVLCVCVPWG